MSSGECPRAPWRPWNGCFWVPPIMGRRGCVASTQSGWKVLIILSPTGGIWEGWVWAKAPRGEGTHTLAHIIHLGKFERAPTLCQVHQRSTTVERAPLVLGVLRTVSLEGILVTAEPLCSSDLPPFSARGNRCCWRWKRRRALAIGPWRRRRRRKSLLVMVGHAVHSSAMWTQVMMGHCSSCSKSLTVLSHAPAALPSACLAHAHWLRNAGAASSGGVTEV